MQRYSSKQSWEEYFLGFNFENVLDGEAISSAVVSVADSDGETVTDTLVDAAKQNIDGTIVYFWIRAGTNGQTYKITCKATGALGSKYEFDATITITNI